MVQKKLQKNSILNKYDIDGDNTITNEELAQAQEIKEIENVRIDTNDKTESQEKVYYFLGFVVLILCLWGLWELSVHIWLNYANTVVGTITGILAIISTIVFFSGLKILGVVFFVSTFFIYSFLDNLIPIKFIKENEKKVIFNEFKKPSKKLSKNSNIKICPSSGYKDNCKGIITYNSGDTYEGFFKNNKRHGKGSYTWKNGVKYVGQWKNDKQNGQGTKTYKNGKIEKGIWENGKFQYAEGSQNP